MDVQFCVLYLSAHHDKQITSAPFLYEHSFSFILWVLANFSWDKQPYIGSLSLRNQLPLSSRLVNIWSHTAVNSLFMELLRWTCSTWQLNCPLSLLVFLYLLICLNKSLISSKTFAILKKSLNQFAVFTKFVRSLKLSPPLVLIAFDQSLNLTRTNLSEIFS